MEVERHVGRHEFAMRSGDPGRQDGEAIIAVGQFSRGQPREREHGQIGGRVVIQGQGSGGDRRAGGLVEQEDVADREAGRDIDIELHAQAGDERTLGGPVVHRDGLNQRRAIGQHGDGDGLGVAQGRRVLVGHANRHEVSGPGECFGGGPGEQSTRGDADPAGGSGTEAEG